MYVATMNHSDIRFTFDSNFRIKEILAPNEFVKMNIEGLETASIHQQI